LPVITIIDSCSANITAANDLLILLPASLLATYNVAETCCVGILGGSGTATGVESFDANVTTRINITRDFTGGEVVTVFDLQLNWTTNAESSGLLELDYDGVGVLPRLKKVWLFPKKQN